MSKRHDSPRTQRSQWLWISVCIFTTLCAAPLGKGGGFGALVSAKPLPQSAVITSRANLKAPTKDRISPPPVDAVLANVRLKPSSPARVRRTVTASGNRSSRAVENDRDRSMRGISHLIDTKRNTNVAPVNRLIGR
jgi:hypothetical protein